ncbi:MAG: ABC transporter ATP-binding protein [Clostridiales bacterium]|nr:ABC transporter ATP-binding protein [Clostridiales bacterium]
MSIIKVDNVHKKFRVYYDKGSTLKEKALFRNRNRYEDRWVLRGISFEAQKGETIGLIGRNGGGKSTLLKLLSRIMYPDEGSIEIKGRVSSLIELGAGFHPDMSGRENIYTNAAIFGLKKKEIDERLDDIIAFSELEEFLDNPVRTYSSGMYMRLAFSVAINVDADVLLIDEILAVGDANFQAKCFNRLRELKAKGVTIVLVTHETNTVSTFCDKAIWLNDGVIQASGKSKLVVDQYLKYMNQELYESIQAQEQRKRDAEVPKPPEAEPPADAASTDQVSAEENPAEQAPVDEDAGKADSNADEEKIDYEANRFGLRFVEITKAGFVNEKGELTYIIRHGERAELRIYYKVNKPLDRYNFGMGFFTLDYVCLYGVNTEMDGHIITQLPDEGYVSFIIDDLMLLSGKYILQVAVVDGNGTPMDYYRNYSFFDVISNVQAVGITEIRHIWKIPE